MIFVCTGSRGYQFDRLIKEIDELVRENKIEADVFAQIGETQYVPTSIEYEKYIDQDEFEKKLLKSNIVITHGGTGTIVGALKKGKNVIAVPRMGDFHEHIDNHQVQIVKQYEMKNLIKAVYDIKDLCGAIEFFMAGNTLDKYNSQNIMVDLIDDYIKKNVK